MTRLARRYARATGLGTVTIAGKTYDVNYARLVFRCEVCHGELRRRNHGLVCAGNDTHRGFIHQRDVAAIQARQTQNTETLNEFYHVVNGKVEVKK
jgi:hypothetical protein